MIAPSPHATRAIRSCPWCERPLRAVVAERDGSARCEGCGMRSEGVSGEDAAHAHGSRCALAERLRERARRRLAQRVATLAPPGPVLDVGSGDGVLLDALRACGRVGTAIGPAPTRAGVRDVDITELGGRYAAIVFWQSLGRLRAPRAALEHAVALLKPGGMLTVAQPAPLALPALTERLLGEPAREPTAVVPRRMVVERLQALGLEIVCSERIPAPVRLGAVSTRLLGGVVAIEARRT